MNKSMNHSQKKRIEDAIQSWNIGGNQAGGEQGQTLF